MNINQLLNSLNVVDYMEINHIISRCDPTIVNDFFDFLQRKNFTTEKTRELISKKLQIQDEINTLENKKNALINEIFDIEISLITKYKNRLKELERKGEKT